jgi:hypothetical protein
MVEETENDIRTTYLTNINYVYKPLRHNGLEVRISALE